MRGWDRARCGALLRRGRERIVTRMRGDCLRAPGAPPGGASRAVPGGARPSAHHRESGPPGYEYEFFYAMASCIDSEVAVKERSRAFSALAESEGDSLAGANHDSC